MSINDLKDDLLINIFNNFNSFEDLLSVSNVCSKWSQFASKRFEDLYMDPKKIKCLLHETKAEFSINTVYIKKPVDFIDLNISRLLPNLKVFEDTSDQLTYNEFDLKKESLHSSIKGVIYLREEYKQFDHNRLSCFPNIEMLAFWYTPDDDILSPLIPKLNQLYLDDGDFCAVASAGKNLLRLRIDDSGMSYSQLGRDVKIPNLKMLEYCCSDWNFGDFPGCDFMDSCPSLESAFIVVGYYDNEFDNSTSTVNLNLLDLVIEMATDRFLSPEVDYSHKWLTLKSILRKYPNLKNLAIRRIDFLTDENVLEILQLLPNIKLLDFRGCNKVTAKSVKNLKEYCEKADRHIEFIHGDALVINYDAYNVVSGFDFMKNCFFRTFDTLPVLLIPEE